MVALALGASTSRKGAGAPPDEVRYQRDAELFALDRLRDIALEEIQRETRSGLLTPWNTETMLIAWKRCEIYVGQGSGLFMLEPRGFDTTNQRFCAEARRGSGMKAEFRSSKFVDFDSGEVFVAPMQLLRQKKKPWDLPDKIEIFECRVDVWQLGVAARMLKEMEHRERKAIWSHAAYGLVAIIFSYFEMIGKTLNPGSKKRHTAGPDFKAGFCDVYPQFRSGSGTPASVVSQFQDRIRNGMYHLAYTKKGLLLHHDNRISREDFDKKLVSDLPKELGLSGSDPVYLMEPHRATRTVIQHFGKFVSRLRSGPEAAAMQGKFLEFFDNFHDPE